ncbi:MAG: cyclic nucleotide-binding domain-containing protein [Pseudomonadota bacterium]
MLGLDTLLAIANVSYLVSYTMRDILWLRILTVLGIALLMPYYYLQPSALWGPIGWNLLFLSINLYWIVKLFLERRPVPFTEEQRRLYEATFRNLSEREALRLFQLGTWRTESAGTALITEGQVVDELTVIIRGNVAVTLDGERVDELGEGRILGATAFLMRDADFRAPVSVTTTESTRLVQWPASELEAALRKAADVDIAIEASLGREVSHFLSTARAHQLQHRFT